jgi:hypothetical protein
LKEKEQIHLPLAKHAFGLVNPVNMFFFYFFTIHTKKEEKDY